MTLLEGRTYSLLDSSDTVTVNADESAALALWSRRLEELETAQGLVWTYPLYDVGSCTRFRVKVETLLWCVGIFITSGFEFGFKHEMIMQTFFPQNWIHLCSGVMRIWQNFRVPLW